MRKELRVEKHVFALVFGLIFFLLHFNFVVKYIYFREKGIPEGFGIDTFDAPLYHIWNALQLNAPAWLQRLFFAVGGSLMYIALGALVGTFFDKLLAKVKELEEKEKKELLGD